MAEEVIPQIANYTDDDIRHLDDVEHIRLRPGMYIGKLGDGSHADDGIYVLIKETVDNSIDEFRMGAGKVIEVTVAEGKVCVRDYGRGIPLASLADCVSLLNTGGKYDSAAFKKSVGLNGVGLKAVNALSWKFEATAIREDEMRTVCYKQGKPVSDTGIVPNTQKLKTGTMICFEPDGSRNLFENYTFREEFIETMMRNYAYLNTGLTIVYNGKRFRSQNGLYDLLSERMTAEALYPIIHLTGEDIEVAITHADQSGEEYYSFVNGQYTIQGGTHQAAFREAVGRTIKEFFQKDFALEDIRTGIVAAISVNVVEPVFESQTKVKLGSKFVDKEQTMTINKFVMDFLKRELDNELHKVPTTTEVMLKKIQDSEEERKAIQAVSKKARERQKKTNINNPKLRDCRIHLNDAPPKKDVDADPRFETAIFITEGNSASGSITKSRNVDTQAVFSLRGKPENTYGLKKDVVYENEEFYFLQAALNIEEGLDDLRYNKVIIATDADVDGMHIRLLMLTFFLQFFPDLIKKGHVYILQTPLFRVKTKKEKRYCYSELERDEAIKEFSAGKDKIEVTRFKGLGEISPDEFKDFIGSEIRLDLVQLRKEDAVSELLSFYMGKNTMERQEFMIRNLVVEEDTVE